MDSIFCLYHDSAISFDEFQKSGWTVNQFLHYRELCSEIRALLISLCFVSRESSDISYFNTLLSQAFEKVATFISSIENLSIEFPPNISSELYSEIRYLKHSNYIGADPLPYIYRSEEDFRYIFEREIFSLLTSLNLQATHSIPFCETQEQALSLQQEYSEHRDSVLNNLCSVPPTTSTESDLYSWAKNKSSQIHEIEDIDAQLSLIQKRLDELSGDGIFDPRTDTLYVYKGAIRCVRYRHDTICVNAIIPTLKNSSLSLNVNFCTQCKQFYISYQEYTHYITIYGALLVKIILIPDGEISNYSNILSDESPLKLCGYSVSQEKGFTSSEREKILKTIIHEGIMKKSEVIQYLNWFIRMQGNRFGNELARSKWESDLNFVRDLDSDLQSNHIIQNISVYGNFGKISKEESI